MAIQTSQLPLSPSDSDALKALLRMGGYQVLKRVIGAHAALKVIDAGDALSRGETVEAQTAAEVANGFNRARLILCDLEDGKLEQIRVELKSQ